MGFFKKLNLKNIGNFVSKNVKSTVKDVGKVGTQIAPLLQGAMQFVPGGSAVGNILGIASNVANQATAINGFIPQSTPVNEQIINNAVASLDSGQATSYSHALNLASKNPNFGDFIKGAGVGALQGVLDTAKNDSNVNSVLASATDNVVMAYIKKHWLKLVGFIVIIVAVGVGIKKLLFNRKPRKRF